MSTDSAADPTATDAFGTDPFTAADPFGDIPQPRAAAAPAGATPEATVPAATASHEVSLPTTIDVPDLPDLGPGVAPGGMRDLRLLSEVQVELSVELGRVRLPLRELLGLTAGSVLELDRAADAPVDVLVNGHPVARGEVVVIDGEFGVRITAVLAPEA